jgi:protein-L-isoaspartate O-methyltransferase
MATAGFSDPRVETAFAELCREDFLGPGPWLVVGSSATISRQRAPTPPFLYLDRVVAILPERHLNNGQPSLHAKLIAEASPQAGEHVVHIGAGTGYYYTAIMAHLVGPSGKVTGIELDPGLAERARDNLSSDLVNLNNHSEKSGQLRIECSTWASEEGGFPTSCSRLCNTRPGCWRPQLLPRSRIPRTTATRTRPSPCFESR